MRLRLIEKMETYIIYSQKLSIERKTLLSLLKSKIHCYGCSLPFVRRVYDFNDRYGEYMNYASIVSVYNTDNSVNIP